MIRLQDESILRILILKMKIKKASYMVHSDILDEDSLPVHHYTV